jgi:uncharacterized membrane protein YecN with MAPEG domain
MISGFYLGLLAIIFIILSAQIIQLRIKHQVGLGDGGNEELNKAIRIHGNFAEYMPLAILLLGVYEYNGGNSLLLHAIGSILVIGRVLHALGIKRSIGTSAQRFLGTSSTFLCLLVLALLNIVAYINKIL